MREYDGPDDKFSLTPVVVEFPNDQFMSATYNGVQLAKR